jgi:argininosuccinate synthase
MASCVLAYSGGLDTSVILGWLIDEGYDVHAVYVDLGQPCEDRAAVMAKAKQCGAKSARIVDAQEELCRDFAFPVLMWGAKYESIYLLGTSIARPLISKVCLQVARDVGAEAYAHGATGKGNDQCRFQLAAEALNPVGKDHRTVADRAVPPEVSRPARDDRLLPGQKHPGESLGGQAL